MIASAGQTKRPDLLESGAPELAGRWRGLAMLTAVAVAVAGAAAGGAVVWASQNGGGVAPSYAPVGMSGSLTLGNFRSTTVDLQSRYQEERGATGRGSIKLFLPDQDLIGEAEVRFAASVLPTELPNVGGTFEAVVHAWGAVTATFSTNVCRGSFSFSYFRQPSEGSGAIQLRCDDGSTFGATMAVKQPGSTFVFDLSDGWYTPSEVAQR